MNSISNIIITQFSLYNGICSITWFCFEQSDLDILEKRDIANRLQGTMEVRKNILRIQATLEIRLLFKYIVLVQFFS